MLSYQKQKECAWLFPVLPGLALHVLWIIVHDMIMIDDVSSGFQNFRCAAVLPQRQQGHGLRQGLQEVWFFQKPFPRGLRITREGLKRQ